MQKFLALTLVVALLAGFVALANTNDVLAGEVGYTFSRIGYLRGDLGPAFLEMNREYGIFNVGLDFKVRDHLNSGVYMKFFRTRWGTISPAYGDAIQSLAPFVGLQGKFKLLTVKGQLALPIGELHSNTPLLKGFEPRLSITLDLIQLFNGVTGE